MNPSETLEKGRLILDEVLVPRGFTYFPGKHGRSSGGNFASGEYRKSNRRLELHFRYSLGLVTYHIGTLSIAHDAYMRAMLGTNGGNRYPRPQDDPLDTFRDLAFDITTYCLDFLSGEGADFSRCVREAQEFERLSGMEKLIRSEG